MPASGGRLNCPVELVFLLQREDESPGASCPGGCARGEWAEGTPRYTGPQVPELPGIPAGPHSTSYRLRADSGGPQGGWPRGLTPGLLLSHPLGAGGQIPKGGPVIIAPASRKLGKSLWGEPHPAPHCFLSLPGLSRVLSVPTPRGRGKKASREEGEGPEIEPRVPPPPAPKRNRSE